MRAAEGGSGPLVLILTGRLASADPLGEDDTMRRELFDSEHDMFRDSFRRWLEKEIVPRSEELEREGIMAREVFAGRRRRVPGDGDPRGVRRRRRADFRYNPVIIEEMQGPASASGLGITLHNDICLPYFLPPGRRGAEAALAAGHLLR